MKNRDILSASNQEIYVGSGWRKKQYWVEYLETIGTEPFCMIGLYQRDYLDDEEESRILVGKWDGKMIVPLTAEEKNEVEQWLKTNYHFNIFRIKEEEIVFIDHVLNTNVTAEEYAYYAFAEEDDETVVKLEKRSDRRWKLLTGLIKIFMAIPAFNLYYVLTVLLLDEFSVPINAPLLFLTFFCPFCAFLLKEERMSIKVSPMMVVIFLSTVLIPVILMRLMPQRVDVILRTSAVFSALISILPALESLWKLKRKSKKIQDHPQLLLSFIIIAGCLTASIVLNLLH